ncbi:putative peptide modification system cyclase [Oleiagrimonas sp.]|jgi:putative peptide modification system cyclase|uniref:putative peptide modification system cyclase n=1 Tax=Oleiagrimonas sp. TaxID=2010330 RepID=UPI00260825C7|nr:putative peptide modification system cyclase [Oleiagrimonas sp.]MDA3912769.1 putative peptide modification system cyclase [Oleiagrimonas sp.]
MAEPLDLREYRRERSTAGQPVLRTMVVCDLADSTALIDRLGDRQAAALIRKHDRMTRALVDQYDGREIDKTDGYLLLFERPTQAVAFALAYQRGLRYMSEAEGVSIRARVGIHVGDVMMWENSPEDIGRGAKPIEVEGLAKPIAARLATLARPQQILLTGVAATIARRGREEIEEDSTDVLWKSYGRYRIRGVAELTEVIEVGEVDVAPLAVPMNRSVAQRIQPWWRRASTHISASAVLVPVLGIGLWWFLRPSPQIGFKARDWVVIANAVNETGSTGYGEAIESALRIGLRQSRYVNVIPATKVQQTLSRMKLGKNVLINRALGTQVAVRDNAKALIVPLIVNYGSGFQLQAEIIDPKNKRVMKLLVANATSEDGIVNAVGVISKKLRAYLGESIAQIKMNSASLAQVTTSSLQALRAYALASKAGNHGDYHLSLDFLAQALSIDPKFASAYMLQGVNYISMGLKVSAKKSLASALKNIDRLDPLEKIKIRADQANLNDPDTAIVAAWKVVADLYPDDPTGSHNAGLYYAGYLNDCESAIPYLKHAASLPQAQAMISTYVLGVCDLATGNISKSIKNLKQAYSSGFRGPFLALADAYVEKRDYGAASEFLAGVPSGSNTMVSLAVRRALVQADQGDLASAESGLRHTLDTITPDVADAKGWALRIDLVGVLWGQGRDKDALHTVQKSLNELLVMNAKKAMNFSYDYPTVVASFARWAARMGDERLAKKAIKVASAHNQLRGYPIRSQLVAITEAEIALHNGNAKKAVRIVTSADSHPLWELLEIIARAKAAAGEKGAYKAYQRVIQKRTLAFGQIDENQFGICSRAIQWNVALLDAADFMNKRNKNIASNLASTFLDNWKLASFNNPYIRRAKSILKSDSGDK